MKYEAKDIANMMRTETLFDIKDKVEGLRLAMWKLIGKYPVPFMKLIAYHWDRCDEYKKESK